MIKLLTAMLLAKIIFPNIFNKVRKILTVNNAVYFLFANMFDDLYDMINQDEIFVINSIVNMYLD